MFRRRSKQIVAGMSACSADAAGEIARLDEQRASTKAGDFTSPYEGATTGRRGRTWFPPALSGTRATIRDGKLLRDRARHLIRNNPWARSGVWTWESECIGTGIRPRFKVENTRLRERMQALWDEWTVQADADDILDFYGLQAMVARAVVESGEIFIRKRFRRTSDGLVVPLQLQLIEADQVPLDHEFGGAGNNRVVAGVEFSPIGRRVAYHMLRAHPGDPFSGLDGAMPVRVPAEYVIHTFKPWRTGDVRGTTWFSNILLKLFDLDKYDDAELLRKQVAALITGFIFPSADETGTPLLNEHDDEDDADDEGADREIRLEAGTLHVMEEPGDLKMAAPADVGDSYEAFLNHQLRAIAVGLGIPFEMLTGDLSRVNFSSIRTGLIAFRRKCIQFQKHVINHQFNRAVLTEWLRQAMLSGALPVMSSSEFRQAVLRTRWIGQGWEWVQPVHEQEANKRAVRSGFKSRGSVVAELGMDPEDLDAEIAEDAARADKFGLVFDSDPRKTTASGAAQDPELESEAKQA